MFKIPLFLLTSVACQQIQGFLFENIDKDCSYCGRSKPPQLVIAPNGRIVLKPSTKYPWIAPIVLKGDPEIACGAAIISSKFLLTAASCLKNKDEEDPSCDTRAAIKSCYRQPADVKVGLMGDGRSKPHKLLEVKGVVINPDYDPLLNLDNIALLELKEQYSCDEYTSPICVPLERMSNADNIYTIATWVRAAAPVVIERKVKRMSAVECQKSDTQEKLRRKIFCAEGLSNGTQIPCIEDSGSPAFADFKGISYALGVTYKHGSDGCPIGKPVSYTNVLAHVAWIKDYVKDLPKPSILWLG